MAALKKIKIGPNNYLLIPEYDLLARSSQNLLINILNLSLSFLSNILLSLILGPYNFGLFKTITSFFEQVPITFGLNITLKKEIPYLIEKKYYGQIKTLLKKFYFFRLTTIIILSFVFFLFRSRLSQNLLKDSSLHFLITLGILIFAINFLDFIRPLLLGLRHYRCYLKTNLFLTLARNFLILILSLKTGINGALIGIPLGSIIAVLPAIKKIKGENFWHYASQPISFARLFWHYSLPIYFISLSGALSGLITPLLALFFSPTRIGYYNFALMAASPVGLIASSIAPFLFPETAWEQAHAGIEAARRRFQKILLLYSFISLPLLPLAGLLLIYLISHYIPLYRATIPLIPIYLILYFFLGLLSLITTFYTASNQKKKAALLNLASSLLFFLASYFSLQFI